VGPRWREGVVNAREELAGFVALQRLLDQRIALQKERRTPPEHLVSILAQSQEKHATLTNLEQRRTVLKDEQTLLERDVAALYEEREHFRKQKTQVTNMRQLTAVVSALDHVDVQLKEKEERLKRIWEELSGIEAEISRLHEESPEDRRLREEAEAAWEARKQGCERELVEVEREFHRVQKELGREAVGRFKKLWEIRKPNPVVPTNGAACSACHAEIRPALLQQVRTGESLHYCESCRRLLYDPQQFASLV
jgi:uncharacterized protein